MIEITPQDIKELVEIALDHELAEFSMDASFYETYDMDSLGAVALVVEVQKRYALRIPDDKMPEITTGTQLEKVIRQLSEETGIKENAL